MNEDRLYSVPDIVKLLNKSIDRRPLTDFIFMGEFNKFESFKISDEKNRYIINDEEKFKNEFYNFLVENNKLSKRIDEIREALGIATQEKIKATDKDDSEEEEILSVSESSKLKAHWEQRLIKIKVLEAEKKLIPLEEVMFMFEEFCLKFVNNLDNMPKNKSHELSSKYKTTTKEAAIFLQGIADELKRDQKKDIEDFLNKINK